MMMCCSSYPTAMFRWAAIIGVLVGSQICGSNRIGDEQKPLDSGMNTYRSGMGDGARAPTEIDALRDKAKRGPIVARQGNGGVYNSGKTGLDDDWDRKGVYQATGAMDTMRKAGEAFHMNQFGEGRTLSGYADVPIDDDDPSAPPGGWSKSQTKLIMKDSSWNGPKEGLKYLRDIAKLEVFDPEGMDSVTATINQLTWSTKQGELEEKFPKAAKMGIAAQWSASQKGWYLLYRSDKKNSAEKWMRFLNKELNMN